MKTKAKFVDVKKYTVNKDEYLFPSVYHDISEYCQRIQTSCGTADVINRWTMNKFVEMKNGDKRIQKKVSYNKDKDYLTMQFEMYLTCYMSPREVEWLKKIEIRDFKNKLRFFFDNEEYLFKKFCELGDKYTGCCYSIDKDFIEYCLEREHKNFRNDMLVILENNNIKTDCILLKDIHEKFFVINDCFTCKCLLDDIRYHRILLYEGKALIPKKFCYKYLVFFKSHIMMEMMDKARNKLNITDVDSCLNEEIKQIRHLLGIQYELYISKYTKNEAENEIEMDDGKYSLKVGYSPKCMDNYINTYLYGGHLKNSGRVHMMIFLYNLGWDMSDIINGSADFKKTIILKKVDVNFYKKYKFHGCDKMSKLCPYYENGVLATHKCKADYQEITGNTYPYDKMSPLQFYKNCFIYYSL